MLASARPHHRQTPSISKPMPAVYSPPPTTSPSPPTSPRAKPKTRRPSVSSPMTWLTRASSSASTHSVPYAPSRPVRISEPRFANPVEALTLPRSGVLGAGAVVVRTPQDALAGTRASVSSPDLLSRARSPSPRHMALREHDDLDMPERPDSPPLPPIPDADNEYEEEEDEDEREEEEETVDWHTAPMPAPTHADSHPPPPTRPPPSLPSTPDYHSEMVPVRAISPLRPHKSPLDCFPVVPTLPAGVLSPTPQSPFSAILVSPAPNIVLDPSKIIVSLETSTATHRTTMTTLTSRPSHLASYLLDLFPAESDTQSVYSTTSEPESSFNSIFNHHLASSGVLKQASTHLHVFLDRPSPPYAHILTYLRSPESTPEAAAGLPHGARLNGSPARMEALLELRDEAHYLGLEELERLCTDELRHRQPTTPGLNGLGLHMRGLSSGSNKSLHTLREIVEPPRESAEEKAALRKSDDSGFASAGSGSGHVAGVAAAAARKSGGSAEAEAGAEAPWPSPPGLKERVVLSREGSPKKAPSATLKARPSPNWI